VCHASLANVGEKLGARAFDYQYRTATLSRARSKETIHLDKKKPEESSLLGKTIKFYKDGLDNYDEFHKKDKRSRKQLEERLKKLLEDARSAPRAVATMD
jgi:hypothetical protein